MASESHTRDSGGTPGRKQVLRRRQEVLGQSEEVANSNSGLDSDTGSDASLEGDKQWHIRKGMPFVAEGSNFVLVANEEEHSFARTGPREADSLRCKSSFKINSYHRKALIAHGVSCAKKHAHAELLAVAAVPVPMEWSGELLHHFNFKGSGGNSILVSVRFEKIASIDDYPRAVKCECGKVPISAIQNKCILAFEMGALTIVQCPSYNFFNGR